MAEGGRPPPLAGTSSAANLVHATSVRNASTTVPISRHWSTGWRVKPTVGSRIAPLCSTPFVRSFQLDAGTRPDLALRSLLARHSEPPVTLAVLLGKS
jgi:hypothetical protein